MRIFNFKLAQKKPHEEYDITGIFGEPIGYVTLEDGLLYACIRTAGNRDFVVYDHTFDEEINEFKDKRTRESFLSKIDERLRAMMVCKR